VTDRNRARFVRRWGLPPVPTLVTLLLPLLLAVSPVQAQVRPDSVRRDTARVAVPVPAPVGSPVDSARERTRRSEDIVADSTRRAPALNDVRGDTITAPLANFELPADFETTGRLRFGREAILSTGAVTLADILDKVPGVTTYRSGWIAGLAAASFAGDASRLRLFVDGVELDPIGARERGTFDLTDLPLWTLDELIIERAAGEVRVWMRTWTVTKTVPYTRVDIFTGDLNTNAFRGQFARRWRSGFLLQLGGQQVATQTGRASAFSTTGLSSGRGDGTVQGFMLRTGWSRGRLAIDLFGNGVSRDRDPHRARTDFTNLPSFKGQRREGYVRVGYGDTSSGFWSQVLVQALRTKLDNADSTTRGTSDTTALQTDTLTSRTQQIAAVGYRATHWQLSLTDRMRVDGGDRRHAPVARVSATFGRLDAGAWVERNARDSTGRADLFIRARPTGWLRVTGGLSQRAPDDSTFRPAGSTLRAEGAVRLRRMWLGGGVLRDDASAYRNLELLEMPAANLISERAVGLLGSVTGPIYKDLRLDVQVLRWNTTQYSRPRMQVHGELALISDWMSKFPKGQFGINTRILYDRRAGVPFFYGTAKDGAVDFRVTEVAQVLTGLLEIRIQQATLFYQYRNLTGGSYEQIRGITMPPAVQMYGVRWVFFN